MKEKVEKETTVFFFLNFLGGEGQGPSGIDLMIF